MEKLCVKKKDKKSKKKREKVLTEGGGRCYYNRADPLGEASSTLITEQ